MSEYTLQLIAFLKIIWVGVFSYLYGLGGIYGKWKRRYLGAFWLMLGVCGFKLWIGSFSWWLLIYFPLLVGSLSLGYGGDELKEKIRKRLIYGSALGCSALPIAIISQSWVLFGFNLILCMCASVVLGVWNPTNARDEETLIAVLSGVLPLYM